MLLRDVEESVLNKEVKRNGRASRKRDNTNDDESFAKNNQHKKLRYS